MMGLWEKLCDMSGEWADAHARKTDNMLDRIERERGGQLNSEQQDKIAHARYQADRMREFADNRRQDRATREYYQNQDTHDQE